MKLANERDMMRYGGSWCDAFYKGDINNPEYFLLVTDNGGSFKVDAMYMLWGKKFSRAFWSTSALTKGINQVVSGEMEIPERDYDYQT
jgi:hypothetical protein